MKNISKNLFQFFPRGIFILFYTEMWELFGRFGITAILVLYLTHSLNFTDAKAFSVYGGFLALIYLMPVFGGFVSDKILGHHQAVILGGIFMMIGNFLLIIPFISTMYLGLSMVALGSGFFLPSIVPLVGQLYQHHEAGRDAGFTLYYLGKNLGALLAPILCGLVGNYFGLNYAFLLSAIGMSSGLIIFLMNKKYLPPILSVSKKQNNYFIYLGSFCVLPFLFLVFLKNVEVYVLMAVVMMVVFYLVMVKKQLSQKERSHLLAILILMGFVIIFGAFLSQGGTTLNLFIDRLVNKRFLFITIPTPFFYALDPIFMMLLGPGLSLLWLYLANHKREPIVVTKFIMALLLLSLGFLIFVLAAHRAMIIGQTSPLYIVIAYFIFPLAELCIMPIGLSMVTRLAPKRLESMTVGIWMLGNAVSGYLTGQLSKIGEITFHSSHQMATIYMHTFIFSTIALVIFSGILVFSQSFIKRLIQ